MARGTSRRASPTAAEPPQPKELLKTVMLPELLPTSCVAIVLDLTEPDSALTSLMTWLGEVRRRVEEMKQHVLDERNERLNALEHDSQLCQDRLCATQSQTTARHKETAAQISEILGKLDSVEAGAGGSRASVPVVGSIEHRRRAGG